jgi:hypothetical protein
MNKKKIKEELLLKQLIDNGGACYGIHCFECPVRLQDTSACRRKSVEILRLSKEKLKIFKMNTIIDAMLKQKK